MSDRGPVYSDCGTRTAYNRHHRLGEKPCFECLAAHSDYVRRRSRALSRLKTIYAKEYLALLAEEMSR